MYRVPDFRRRLLASVTLALAISPLAATVGCGRVLPPLAGAGVAEDGSEPGEDLFGVQSHTGWGRRRKLPSPTPAPTLAPTPAPTLAPTQAPTLAPTPAPTLAP
ncbi:MAG: hypothetical protein FJZ01_16760, partial [Candidatus Sericytochromatia bacterium]|nr:hypothetical protein [Candidatus Tanganyikabacteria bacterium]